MKRELMDTKHLKKWEVTLKIENKIGVSRLGGIKKAK